MRLSRINIRNFRTLEDVTLDNLAQINVIVGKNNAGKSFILSAIHYVAEILDGRQGPFTRILPFGNCDQMFEIEFSVQLGSDDRDRFITMLAKAASLPKTRITKLASTPFLKDASFAIRFYALGPALHRELYETRVRTEDGDLAIVQRIGHSSGNGGLVSGHFRLTEWFQRNRSEPLTRLAVGEPPDVYPRGLWSAVELGNHLSPSGLLNHGLDAWLQREFFDYVRFAFFFSPFRHSTERLPALGLAKLDRQGGNLAQVLLSTLSHDRPKFETIEAFIQEALPNIGHLQVPLEGTECSIVFRRPEGGYPVPLHDMGGGVEQLLMVAAALHTTDDGSALFLEEPETHLHPSAQRFLLERLIASTKQVFITTHSPVFLNGLVTDSALYSVVLDGSRSTVTQIRDLDPIESVLSDIGVRNSDVFLSDAVLFVEGPSDESVIRIWARTLGMSIDEHNVTVICMGGGRYAGRSAPQRQSVLEGISQKAPIPHLFLIDRDERNTAAIDKIRSVVKDHIHVLKRRELENYLLAPRAILAALRIKHEYDPAIFQRLSAVCEDEVETRLAHTIDGLYGLAFAKRACATVSESIGGFIPSELARELALRAKSPEFPALLQRGIEQRLQERLSNPQIESMVQEIKVELDSQWVEPSRRPSLVPGEEVLADIYKHFGSKYAKTTDAERIAREMTADEIPEEIRNVIGRAVALPA